MDDNLSIDALITKVAEDAEAMRTSVREEPRLETREEVVETKTAVAFLNNLASSLEKMADTLPLDEAPVPGEQAKTQDSPIAEHDQNSQVTSGNALKDDERDPVKETQGHLGHEKPKMDPVSPDAPNGVASAPAKTASYLRELQRRKIAEALGYDTNAEAAKDRSAELLNETNQVGYSEPEASSGKLDKNQQAIDDTPRQLAEPEKKDMGQLLNEPMASKKTDSALADAFPSAEPQAQPKIGEDKTAKVSKKVQELKKSQRDVSRALQQTGPTTTKEKGKAIGGLAGLAAGATLGALTRGKAPISKTQRALQGALGAGAGTLAGGALGGAVGKRVGVLKQKTAESDAVIANFLKARQAEMKEGA